MHKGWLRLFFITAYIAFGAVTSALGAPLCASLFETLSKESGSLTVNFTELANLKMKLDLAKAQGTAADSPELTVLRTAYEMKIAEIRRSKSLSEVEIKNILGEKVRVLQKQENQNHEKEVTDRAEQIKAHGIFVHKSLVKLHPVAKFRDFNYIPHLQKLSIHDVDGMRIFNLVDGKRDFGNFIWAMRGFKALPDLKHGLALHSGDPRVALYEIGKPEPLQIFPTELPFTDGAGIDFSPSGQHALLTDYYGKAHVLNFESKAFKTISMPGKISYSYAKRFGYFINETVILVTGEGAIARIDLVSDMFIEKDIFPNEQHQAVISQDRKTLLVYTSTKMIALNAETLEPLSAVVNFEGQGKTLEEVVQVPGTNQLWARLKSTFSQEQSFASEIEVPQFEFQSPFTLVKDTTQITLSSDGSEAFVVHKGDDNRFYFEHWQR